MEEQGDLGCSGGWSSRAGLPLAPAENMTLGLRKATALGTEAVGLIQTAGPWWGSPGLIDPPGSALLGLCVGLDLLLSGETQIWSAAHQETSMNSPFYLHRLWPTPYPWEFTGQLSPSSCHAHTPTLMHIQPKHICIQNHHVHIYTGNPTMYICTYAWVYWLMCVHSLCVHASLGDVPELPGTSSAF